MKKKYLLLLVIFAYVNAFSAKWETISELTKNSFTIRLEWKLTSTDFRLNPDGTKFANTHIRLYFNDGNKNDYFEIPDVIYSSGQNTGGGTPCMLIDPISKYVTIFVLEKDYSSSDYGMTGYAYQFNSSNGYFTKETIFTRSNFGWFAFFGGSNYGNPTLCHFSFAGYKAVESKRNNDGTWSNYVIGDIKPDVAANQWKSHANILVTNESNIDKMNGVYNNSYSMNNQYDPVNNRSTTLSEDEKTVLFLGGLFLVGTAIVKGIQYVAKEASKNGGFNSSQYYADEKNAKNKYSNVCGDCYYYDLKHKDGNYYSLSCFNLLEPMVFYHYDDGRWQPDGILRTYSTLCEVVELYCKCTK